MKSKFALRISSDLKSNLENVAKIENRSLNQQIEKILSEFIKSEGKKVKNNAC